MPSIMSRRAPGMARAVARPPEGATSLSAVPWMTRVGAVMWRSSAVRSPEARMAASWRVTEPGSWPRSYMRAEERRAGRRRRARSRASR